MLVLIAAIGVVVLIALVIRHQIQARKLEAISRSHGDLQDEVARLARLARGEDGTRDT